MRYYATLIGQALAELAIEEATRKARRQAIEQATLRGRAERVKPRLVRVFNHEQSGFEWRCSDHSECWAIGWGATREAAYEQWLARFAHCRRSRQQ